MLENMGNTMKMRWRQFYNLLVEPSLSAEGIEKTIMGKAHRIV